MESWLRGAEWKEQGHSLIQSGDQIIKTLLSGSCKSYRDYTMLILNVCPPDTNTGLILNVCIPDTNTGLLLTAQVTRKC